MADLARLERGLWTFTGTSRLSPITLQFVPVIFMLSKSHIDINQIIKSLDCHIAG